MLQEHILQEEELEGDFSGLKSKSNSRFEFCHMLLTFALKPFFSSAKQNVQSFSKIRQFF